MDSISDGYISWSIHPMWMIYITFERGAPKVWIPLERLPSAQPCSRVRCERNGYYADLALHFWPPRSPDLTPCDFCLWGFVTEAVYVRPLPTTLVDVKNRITTAVNSVTQDILLRVWDEFSYRLDVIRAAGGGGGAHWTSINFIVNIIKYTLHHICHWFYVWYIDKI
jgi:hypothetical protein